MTNWELYCNDIADIFMRDVNNCKNLYLKVNRKGCYFQCENCPFLSAKAFVNWLKEERQC